jgi:hypothetical protein
MTLANSERQKFPATLRTVFAVQLTLLLLLLPSYCLSAQSAPAQCTPAPPQQSDAGKKKDHPQKQSAPAPAKPRKVITNDDPEFQHSVRPRALGEITPHSGREFLFGCDLDCERQAKEILQYGPDQEADWQMQLVSAHRDLSKDQAWRETLWRLIQVDYTACSFQEQQAHDLQPSGNDFNSRMQRAQREQYFKSWAESLRMDLDSASRSVNGRIQEVNALFPVRAAMMQVQASRIGNLSCGEIRQLFQ